jgi:threonine aldolase
MRQSGMLAAGCLYALDHHIDRLAEDHVNARSLVRGLAQIPGIAAEEAHTNLVFFNTQGAGMTAAEFAGAARRQGIAFSTNGRYRVRACTHLGVTAAQIEQALAVARQVLAKA